MVADGAVLRLYRNGRLVASEPCRGIGYPLPLNALGIGCKLNDQDDAPSASAPAFWHGKLDEIVVVNRAVSGSMLERLSTTGSGQRAPERDRAPQPISQ